MFYRRYRPMLRLSEPSRPHADARERADEQTVSERRTELRQILDRHAGTERSDPCSATSKSPLSKRS